ncbi:PASTA domain-containing protein [Bifidobacterium saguinibicoloris]|uniref:PASTA domain-containing protein n=1 Tax=Bifidobacterium saguinibicoloris TaxID=2834433 RepID=UPI001C596B8A|nr:PASTA domain-containing protein [Bifidobacterium saguinibicoloris]MBW3080315.1 PASTA domain-containing protein [Bifidobacterium saguinibicoloris]
MPPVPGPSQGPNGPAASAADGGPAKRGRGRKTLLIVVIALLVLAVAGGVAAFLTYRAELWGGRSLPDVARLAAGTNGTAGEKQSKKSAVTAKAVTEALKDKGLKSKTVQEFTGEPRGTFLGYQGLKEGQRIKAGSTVTVRESAGPGVPKGTVGKKASKVVKTFNGMGVPVHYKQVIINDTKQYPNGSVVETSPSPGQPVSKDDAESGIIIGVATEGDGLGFDILGTDKDTTAKRLQSQGHKVDLEPHYSSKQYVGKISGSDPAPGSPLESGQSVTLYYGVDKSSNMDLFSERLSDVTILKENPSPMVGTYCRSTVRDTSKDCLTLGEDDLGLPQLNGGTTGAQDSELTIGSYTQNVIPLSGEGLVDGESPMKNHLFTKDWGMFELYAGVGMAYCGDEVLDPGPGMYCDAGTVRVPDFSDMTSPVHDSGATFRMEDFLVYVPVGSDLKALEDSGYFDKSALAAANKQKAVDTSRPFIVMRDPSQYEETSVSADDNVDPSANPFVPGDDNGVNHLVKMKPAPSDATVYYLVEQNGDLDWDSLPDAKVSGVKDSSGSSDSSGSDSGDSGSSAGSVDSKAMFTQVAGEYSWPSAAISRTDLTLRPDGTFNAAYTVANDENVAHLNYDTPSTTVNVTGRFSSIKETDTGYTLQCDAKSLKVEGGGDSLALKGSGMAPCGTWRWYSGGTTFGEIRDETGAWGVGGFSTDRKDVALASDHGSGALFLRMS